MLNKEIDATLYIFKFFTILKLVCFIPPKGTTIFFVSFFKLINLKIPKFLLYFLLSKRGDKKIYLTFCFSLILISLREWADPNNINLFFKLNALKFKLLLKDGI